jgi:hypothetical protein
MTDEFTDLVLHFPLSQNDIIVRKSMLWTRSGFFESLNEDEQNVHQPNTPTQRFLSSWPSLTTSPSN